MENYSYSSYPDSGNSSPRSREIDFDNQPWDEQQQQNYKAKFMCSYGGKIHPRPHDNQLSYIGGETKILSVDRGIKLSAMIARLAALCGEADVAFKYQLSGEDLDALISVTNDDDLDHMMHEYDRLYRLSPKPARMRLFIFPVSPNNFSPGQAVGSERDRFVEALNSVPAPDLPKPAPAGNVDFLFGMQEKGVAPPPPLPAPPVMVPDPVGPAVSVREAHVEMGLGGGRDDRVFGSDHGVSPAEIQRQLQELQRLQIGQEAMYRRKSEDGPMGGFGGGGGGPANYYVQNMPEKSSPVTIQSSVPISAPPGYWPDHKQMNQGGGFAGAMTGQPEQPLYMIPGHGGLYPAPQMGRPVTGQPTHSGYYAVQQQQQQRLGPDAYRDQPMFNVGPPQQPTLPPQQQIHRMTAAMSTEGIVTGRPGSGLGDHIAYAQMGYDGATGRQVFYTAGGGVVATAPPPPAQYQGMAAVTADMRHGGQVMGQDGKVIAKVSQGSV